MSFQMNSTVTKKSQIIPSVSHKKVVKTPSRKIFAKSTRAKNEAQPGLDFDGISQDFELPPLSLLTNPYQHSKAYVVR